jgi:hypothetical protein
MLFHYLVKYCQPPTTTIEKLNFLYKHPRSIYTGKKLIRMEGVTTEVVQEIAEQSEGFSGRELTKMVVAWHDAAFTLPEPILTPELMRKVLKKFHLQHELKKTWSKEEAAMMEKMLFIDEEKILAEIKGEKSKHHERDPEMVKEQERIAKEIEQERLNLKAMRETKV